MTWALLVVGAASCHPQASPAPCVFPAPSKSTVAWGVPTIGGRAALGRVVSVAGGAPIAEAVVRLEPGGHLQRTDQAGFFRFGNVSPGRYRLSVTPGPGSFQGVTDSIVNSEFGVEMLVALASYPPDLLECIRTRPR